MSALAVPGGVVSAFLSTSSVVFTDGVRRCRVRYDVDLGISGLDVFGDAGWPGSNEDLRLKTGDEVLEAAGEREVGGV